MHNNLQKRFGDTVKRIAVPNDIQQQIMKDYESGLSVLALSKKYGYKYDKTYSIIRENNLSIRGNDFYSKKYYCNSKVFDVIDTEEKAYWLGFLYADGCIVETENNLKLSLAISVNDIKHLEKFKDFMNTESPIHIYRAKGFDSEYCRIQITDRYLCEQLIRKGMYIRKTEILTFPCFLEESLIRHFIRGYVDGDGCITYYTNKNTSRLVFALKICSTKEMLIEISAYLPKRNDRSVTLEKRNKNNVNNYSVSYGGNIQVKNMLDYLYGNSTIYLDRKYERYLLLKNYCA